MWVLKCPLTFGLFLYVVQVSQCITGFFMVLGSIFSRVLLLLVTCFLSFFKDIIIRVFTLFLIKCFIDISGNWIQNLRKIGPKIRLQWLCSAKKLPNLVDLLCSGDGLCVLTLPNFNFGPIFIKFWIYSSSSPVNLWVSRHWAKSCLKNCEIPKPTVNCYEL